jgi:GNAT superfamily N-acetyltransferase
MGTNSVSSENNIREARLDDASRIREIIYQSSVFTSDEEYEILHTIEHYTLYPEGDELLTYVYTVDGRVAGFVSFGLGLGNKTYEVYWICVSLSHQGNGIGARLLAFAEAYALHAGARILFVETSSKREYCRARTLYEHGGYEVSAVVRDYFDDGDDKVIYSKKLAARPSPAS